MADREADDVGLDLFQRAEVAVGTEQRHPTTASGYGSRATLAVAKCGDLRKVLLGQCGTFAEYGSAEECILQLADVAGPVLVDEQLQRSVRDAERAQSRLLGDPREQMAGERRDVAGALA